MWCNGVNNMTCNQLDNRIKCISSWLNNCNRGCVRMIPENRFSGGNSCCGSRIVYTSSCR